ncbi:MAG: T9SS type A sorting domain-containing protein [Bacteroidota bacterium]
MKTPITCFFLFILSGMTLQAQSIVRIISIDPFTETLTLKNFGDVEQDISNYQLCLGPGQYGRINNYTVVSGDFALMPNEEITIDVTSGTQNVTAIPDAAGGMGLFSQGGAFGSTNPSIYLDYVQWGGPNQARAQQAVNAGRWDNAANFVSGTSPYIYNGGVSDVGSTFWSGDITLQVELISFSLEPLENTVLLEWSTAAERNSLGFSIQRSSNAIDWTEIGFIEGKGSENQGADYSFEDRLPLPGLNYYRLQEMDLDGDDVFSSILSLRFGDSMDMVGLFPNPATTDLFITGIDPIEIKRVLIHDTIGQLRYESTFFGGCVPTGELSAGWYSLSIFTENNQVQRTFIKQ